MKLANITISKVKLIDKAQKLFDGGGLFLEVTPKGAKFWRFEYRFGGKEKLLSLGVFPEIPYSLFPKEQENAKPAFRWESV